MLRIVIGNSKGSRNKFAFNPDEHTCRPIAVIEGEPQFFVDYHRLSNKKYRAIGIRGIDRAWKRIKAGMKR